MCPAPHAFRIASLAFCLLPMIASAEEWSRFRGPNGSGVVEAKNLPATFDESTTVWKREMSRGWSSPVVWKDKIFLTAETGTGKRAIECLSAKDGSTLWVYEVPYTEHRQHKFNAFASSTPCVDDQRIYVNWTNGNAVEALAVDHAGKLVWRRETIAPYVHEHGSGVSSVVADGIMVVRCESEPDAPSEEAKSSVLGLDAGTGKTVWTLPMPNSKNPYSTPLVRKTAAGNEFIIANTTSGFMGIDTKTGKVRWQHNPGFTQRSVGSFAYNGHLLFGTMGSGAGGKESAVLNMDEAEPREAYQLTSGIPYVTTPLIIGDLMYMLGDGGILKCVKVETGEQVYNERLSGAAGNSTKYFSSPVAGDGKIYCCSQTGDVLVVKAGPQFSIVGANKLDSPVNATPALADSRIYIRTERMLWSLGTKNVPIP